MAVDLLRPDRRLAHRLGYHDGDMVMLYRTEWHLRGERIDATHWTPNPRQAIGDGLDADEGYRRVVQRPYTTAA